MRTPQHVSLSKSYCQLTTQTPKKVDRYKRRCFDAQCCGNHQQGTHDHVVSGRHYAHLSGQKVSLLPLIHSPTSFFFLHKDLPRRLGAISELLQLYPAGAGMSSLAPVWTSRTQPMMDNRLVVHQTPGRPSHSRRKRGNQPSGFPLKVSKITCSRNQLENARAPGNDHSHLKDLIHARDRDKRSSFLA